MKNIISRILKIISSAVFVILILLIVLILFYIFRVNFLAKNDRLGDVRFNMYTILTQSMYPTIHAGDVVITYKDEDDHYDKGDVITFISESNGNINITHRVNNVYMVNGIYSYETKGDNNNAPDHEIVKGSNVLGKVVVKVPKVGYIQQFIVSKTGFIVAVLLPCLGVVIYDILKIFKTVTRKSVTLIKNDNASRLKLKEVINDEKDEE